MKSLPAFCRLSVLVSQGFLSTLSFLSAQAVNIHVIFQSLMFFCILHTFLSAAGSPLWFKKKRDKMASFPIMRLCQQSKPAWRCLNIVVCDRWAVSVTQSSSTCSLFLKVTDTPPLPWSLTLEVYNIALNEKFVNLLIFDLQSDSSVRRGFPTEPKISEVYSPPVDCHCHQRKFNLNDSEYFFPS